MLTNRQTFQKIFLSCISCCHSLSDSWMNSLLLGPGCLLWSALCLEVFDPCRPCTCSACFFSFQFVSPAPTKGDSTPSPSLVLPPIHYPCGTAHTWRCQLCHEWNIREIGSFVDIRTVTHQPTFECWSKIVECLTHLAPDTLWDLSQFRPERCLLSLVSLAPSLSD